MEKSTYTSETVQLPNGAEHSGLYLPLLLLAGSYVYAAKG